jgi:small subunit ribosomal protein S16
MATKIRLQRKGRKKLPYYYIVVADSRSPRDGKFIERIGSYNPNINPAAIDLDTDKALEWVIKGAQPTDTCRAILSYKGVMYRKHLQRGVAKEVLTQEDADKKYADWLEGKAQLIDKKVSSLKSSKDLEERTRLEREAKVAHKRAQEIMAKRNPAPEAPAEEEAAVETTEEAPVNEAANETPEAVTETPASEEPEPKEAPKEEVPEPETPDQGPSAEAASAEAASDETASEEAPSESEEEK